MNLVQRVQDILLRPTTTWPAIEQEPADVASLYTRYVLILAAIPAVAGFIGMTLIGVGGFGMHIRVPFMWGLTNMVVSYVLSLVMVFVIALIVDALAPNFGGTKSQINALKLVAYGATAGFVGGIFGLIPSLSVLGLLAALYSIYLVYTGLPVLMKCPPGKAAGYTAVVVVCGIVAGIVIGAISAAVTPSRGLGRMGGMHGERDVTITTPKGEVTLDTSKLDEMAKRMEEAGKRMEAAQKSGDSAAAGKAMSEMVGAMAGATGEALPPQELKALLPESLGSLRRDSIEAQSNQAMGVAGSSAKARYTDGSQRVDLSITDLGGMAGIAALAGWAGTTLDKETDTAIERVYKQGNRTVREKHRKDGSHGEVTVLLANGVVVEADGRKVEPAALKAIVEGLDLARLESMKRPAKS
ncbi:Yip1 family protein [Piscinibacter gummiphilus]|uniref:Yip1 family protein n=1 Tax=Piscinibacter gummiphilus TaxID=946333 RepID=A0ABZ0CZN8_9BURK|nr:Yip1 family protein [Piscinibacter gummiphilus]WOB08308.1 Yip1 family protein [Piscinibacter gummiphilus]